MKVVSRKLLFRVMVCATICVMTLVIFSRTKMVVAAQQAAGQSVDPANPSDELVDGPYRVDPNWPKPLATLFPEEKGWTWGAVQGVFAQNPDRIFVVMRGELPDVTKIKPKFAELENEFGMPVHLQVPGVGMYPRNASVVNTPARAKPPTTTWASTERITAGTTSLRFTTARGM